jgi:hypothetical protein
MQCREGAKAPSLPRPRVARDRRATSFPDHPAERRGCLRCAEILRCSTCSKTHLREGLLVPSRHPCPSVRDARGVQAQARVSARAAIAAERLFRDDVLASRVASGVPVPIEFDLNGRKLTLEEEVVRELQMTATAGAGASSILRDLAFMLDRALTEEKPVSLQRAEARALERLLAERSDSE